MAKKIVVRAGDSENSIGVVEVRHSMKDAKARAKYLVGAEYARMCEMSEPFAFAGVYVDGVLEFEV